MFICNFTEILFSNNPKTQNKLKGLTLLSEQCVQQNIHPAQGLRVTKRKLVKEHSQLRQSPQSQLASTITKKVLKTVQPKNISTVTTSTVRQYEHFILTTIIPQPLNKVTGYLSPIIDVQPDIHFIRTQRRYNKRRYARVRAVSRPSFWSGMMLSTVCTGAFWGSTIQATDWLTTTPIVPDPNLIITIGYILVSYKAWTLHARAGTPYARELNRARRGWQHNISIV